MKTWNIPSLEELDVRMTAGGEEPCWDEHEYNGDHPYHHHACPRHEGAYCDICGES